jgi:hypothetical protein
MANREQEVLYSEWTGPQPHEYIMKNSGRKNIVRTQYSISIPEWQVRSSQEAVMAVLHNWGLPRAHIQFELLFVVVYLLGTPLW